MLCCWQFLMAIRDASMAPGTLHGTKDSGKGVLSTISHIFSTTLAKMVEKFAAGVVDRWCTLTCEYLRKFSKKFETVLMEYSGAGGKLFHEKNQKQKIS
jgi:hypothetical protein